MKKEEKKRLIEEGLKLPNNEPIKTQHRDGNRNINFTYYFGTKTEDQIIQDMIELTKLSRESNKRI